MQIFSPKKLRISNKEEHTCLSKEKQQESEANRQGLQQIPECVKIDTASCCLFYLPPEVGTDFDDQAFLLQTMDDRLDYW